LPVPFGAESTGTVSPVHARRLQRALVRRCPEMRPAPRAPPRAACPPRPQFVPRELLELRIEQISRAAQDVRRSHAASFRIARAPDTAAPTARSASAPSATATTPTTSPSNGLLTSSSLRPACRSRRRTSSRDLSFRRRPAGQRRLRSSVATGRGSGHNSRDERRLPSHCRPDTGSSAARLCRSRSTVDRVTAYEGESVAGMLLAEGHPAVRMTQAGEPRGIYCGMGVWLRLPRGRRRGAEHARVRDVGAGRHGRRAPGRPRLPVTRGQ